MERRVGMFISSDPDVTRIEAQPEGIAPKPSVQLPLRLLLVSDLLPHAGGRPEGEGSALLRMDRSSFPALMQQLSPRLRIEVPNRMSEAPRLLDLELEFPALRSFEPVEIARRIPALAALLEVREAVDDTRQGRLDGAAMQRRLLALGMEREWVEKVAQALTVVRPAPQRPAAPPPSASSGDTLDRLLGLVDVGGTASPSPPASEPAPAQRPGGLFESLIGAVTGGAGASRVDRSAAEQVIADLDAVVTDQLQEVVSHPEVRGLEAAWRGLKLLVDRLDFRRGVELDVLPATRSSLSEVLYHQVLIPEHKGRPGRAPLSAVILDLAFSRSAADLEQLDDLADTGASLQLPIIASVGAAFFGVERPEGIGKVPVLRQHLSGPEYIGWHKLRESENARFLALAAPPFVLRAAHGSRPGAPGPEIREHDPLWGNSALLVAVAMGDAFVETGWPTYFTGAAGHRIGDLPTWNSGRGEIPLATLLSGDRQEEFAEAGFVVLGCRADHDAASVAFAPTIRKVDAYDSEQAGEEMRGQASLACQLFVARAAQFLMAYQGDLQPGVPLPLIQAELTSRLRNLLRVAGDEPDEDSVAVEHVPHAGTPGTDVLAVRLRAPRSVLADPVSLVMSLSVPA